MLVRADASHGRDEKEKVKKLVRKQNKWRGVECLNMIASENVMSPLAENYYTSDFAGRYNEHEGGHTYYQGTKYASQIEEYCNTLFGDRFHTENVDCRPISGAIANLCAYKAFLNPGDVFISPSLTAGGHISTCGFGLAGVRGVKDIDMYFDPGKMQVDVERTVALINKVDPKLLLLGRSMFLFPEPIKEITQEINPEITVVYDAAHVLGLIYAGMFQQPLEEGVDLITGSTHKTFPGPQGGILIANEELTEKEWRKVSRAVFPGILSNHHIHRLPSLAITALEMNEFGAAYAQQTIENAKTLGQALYEKGFNVFCPERDFTETHQIVVDVQEIGGGRKVAETLEENNIIVNKNTLPLDKGEHSTKNPSGIRIGVQELTRWGMQEGEMKTIAEFFEEILQKDKKRREEVKRFRARYQGRKYCFKT